MPDPSHPTSVAARVRRRPFGIWVVVTAHLALAALVALAAAGEPLAHPGTGPRLLVDELPDLIWTQGALVVFGLIVIAGLLRLEVWGWYGAMLFTGLGLATQIALHAWGSPNYLYLAIFTIEAFYLNQRGVRPAFEPDPVAAVTPIVPGDRPIKDGR